MEINRDAPVRSRREVQVDAPPTVVWDVLADVDAWPRWNDTVKTATLGGPVARGTKFRWKAGPTTITSTLEEVERPERLGWTGRALGLSAVHMWRLQPRDGGTHVTTEESMQGGLARLLRPLIQKNVDESLLAWVGKLKAEAESRSTKESAP